MGEERSIADLVTGLDDDLKEEEFHEVPSPDNDEGEPVDDSYMFEEEEKDSDPTDYTNLMDQYIAMLQESCEQLSKIDGGYRGKLQAYIDKRTEESELYRDVALTKTVGADCNMQEVSRHTSRRRWKSTTNIYGPAWKREILRKPRPKIRGLTAEEARRVNKNRSDRELWNKILAGVEGQKDDKDIPLSQLELEEQARKNLKEGKFHLLRKIPTKYEQEKSTNRWSRGIFFPWELDKSSTEFPYIHAIDTDVKPSSNVIKDYVPYSRYNERDNSTNTFVYNGASTLKDGFTVHWRMMCLAKADKALAEAKERKRLAAIQREADAKAADRARRKNEKLRTEKDVKALDLYPENWAVNSVSESSPDTSTFHSGLKDVSERNSGDNSLSELPSYLEEGSEEAMEQETRVRRRRRRSREVWSFTRLLTFLGLGARNDMDTAPRHELVPLEKNSNQFADSMTLGTHSHAGEKASVDAERMLGDDTHDNITHGDGCVNTESKGPKDATTVDEGMGPDVAQNYKDTERGQSVGMRGRAKKVYLLWMAQLLAMLRRTFIKAKVKPVVEKDAVDNGNKVSATKDDKPPKTTHSPPRREKIDNDSVMQPSIAGKFTVAGSTTSKPNSKNKSGDGIIRKKDVFAVCTVPPPPMKKKKKKPKKKKDDEGEQPKEEVGFFGKIREAFLTRKHAFAEEFKMREESDEYNKNLFAAPPSVADRHLVETLFTVRSMRRATARRIRLVKKVFSLGLAGADPEDDAYCADDLKQAAVFGHYEKCVDIMDHWSEISPNARCEAGDTPFYAACLKALQGEPEVETDEYVVNVGLIGLWNKMKKCLKKKRFKKGKIDLVVKILYYKGGDVNVVALDRGDGDGLALIHVAAEKNMVDLAKWLHARQVNVHQETATLKRTPLMVAARKGHGDMVHRLLHMGAIDTINKQDAEGWTALHFVATYCDPEYVEMMMICGANMSIRNKGNRLPLEEAQTRGRMECVQAIMTYKDRSRLYRHQISYFNEEVLNGRVGGESVKSGSNQGKSIAGSIASGFLSLSRSNSMKK